MAIQLPGTGTHLLQRVIVLTAIGTLPAYATAQTAALEEVIVTASKRTESLQDVPMSVSAFNEQTIQQANINNADDLAIIAPSLTITTNTQPNTAAFRIRGIGTSQTDIALEPSVGVFVDEVYLPRSGLAVSDLTDIERIEILQGPQGTLYGKNTNAGAISIITRRPNREEYEGYVETTYGNYDMQRYIAAASGPITDTLAFRLSGSFLERDGYLENGGPGKDLNDADEWNVMGKLLYEPSDELSVLINGTYVDRNPRCCAADAVQGDSVNEQLTAEGFAPDKNDPFDEQTAVNIENDFDSTFKSLSMVVDYDLDWGAFKSITAWTDNEGSNSYDPDRSQLDVMSYLDAYGASDSLSQELRVTFEQSDDFEHMLGLFYFESTTKGGDGNPFVFLGEDFLIQGNQQQAFLDSLPAPLDFLARPGDSLRAKTKLETKNAAVFGQSVWTITDVWRVTGGLRWTYEKKHADLFTQIDSTAPSQALVGTSFLTSVSTPIDDSFTRHTDDVNWLINTSYDLLADTMVYAVVATGSKSGGFNTVNGTPQEREFEDEDTISYEAGIKSTLLDARLRVNAALFYTEIDNYQFQEQLETGIGTRVSNQAEVETSGLDLEIQAAPLQNLTLTAGLLYMDKYEITGGPQKGDDLPFTAEYSYTLSATLVFPLYDGGIYLRTDYSYMDDHLTTASVPVSDHQIQDREDLNAKLGWRNDNWNISIWGKNLTEDDYAPFTASTFPMTSMDAYWLAPPRTYGATLRYSF